jgi:glycosyltransferase involved in cell wall biosynthesis
MKIVANMIGHNEADRYLPDVLKHLRPLVDEIVFTDDASTDNTLEVAQEFGAHAYKSLWKEPMFKVNEGRLRQTSWWNMENHAEEGDWILAIDCDEKLYETFDKIKMRDLIQEKEYDVINIKFVHMWSNTHFRVDKLWAPTDSQRLFRYQQGARYKNRNLACGAEPMYVIKALKNGRYLRNSGLMMQHLGYAAEGDKALKHERYMELDKGKYHNIDHLNSIIDKEVELVEWKLGDI